MRALALAALLLAGCGPEAMLSPPHSSGPAPADSVSAAAVLAAWQARDASLVAVPVVAPHPSRPGVVAAALESDGGWSRLSVFALEGGAVAWTAGYIDDAEHAGQTVLSLRWVDVAGFSEPLLELYDQTSRGNGWFYLFTLEGRTLVQRAQAYAVDSHLDGSLGNDRSAILDPSAGYRLAAHYPEGEPAAVRLQGTVQVLGADDAVERTEPCTVWLQWNAEAGRFILDPARLDCALYADQYD